VAQAAAVVQRQSLAAEGAGADVVAQAVEQYLVYLVGHALARVHKRVLDYLAVEGVGEGEVEVELAVILFQLGQGRFVRGQTRLLYALAALPSGQELEKQLAQGVLRLVKGYVCRAQLLLFREDEAHLAYLGDDGDVARDVQLAV